MYGVGARGFGLLARTIRGRERGSAGAGAGGRRRGDAGGGGRTRGEGVEGGPVGKHALRLQIGSCSRRKFWIRGRDETHTRKGLKSRIPCASGSMDTA
jgi:hypothetical protein